MKQAKALLLTLFIFAFAFASIPPATGSATVVAQKKGAKKGGNKKNSALAAGAKVFDVNCATCHEGGGNSIEADKTLHMDALKANGYAGPDDIKKCVEEGKGIMPVFKDQLKPEEIDSVSVYVWAKAQSDWK